MYCKKNLVIAILIAIGLAVGLSGIAVTQQKVKYASWLWDEPTFPPFRDSFYAAFEKEYPNIKIEEIQIPHAQYWDKIIILASEGPAPDVVHVVYPKLKMLMMMNALEPIDNWMDLSRVKETYVEGQRTLPVENGKTYGVSTGGRTLELIYNKKLFQEAGIKEPPTFPAELVAASMKLTQPEKRQYGIGVKTDPTLTEDTYEDILGFVVGYDSNFAKDGVPMANDPKTILGMKLYSLLCELEVTPVGIAESIMRTMFQQGKIAMKMGTPADLFEASIKAPEVYLNLDAAHTPFPNKAAIGGLHLWLAIPKKAENKTAAAKFIEFWSRPKWQAFFTEKCTPVPPTSEALPYLKDFINENPWFRVYMEGMEQGVTPLPEGFEREADEFMRIVVKHTESIIYEKRPVELAMDQCQRELMKLKK